MKLFLLFNLIFTVSVFSNTYSQNMISIEMRNTSVKNILNQIEESSHYRFFYNEELSDINRLVSIDMQDKEISEVMHGLLSGTDLEYTVLNDNMIVIAPKREDPKHKITGQVTDGLTGESLIGVTILVGNTRTGTTTDINGRYVIEVDDPNTTLHFSYVGYLTESIDVNGRTIINLTILQDIKNLGEVVFVGYGTMRKSDLTGAISSIRSEDMNMAAASSVTQMIQGKASGVQIIQQSAQPGGGLSILVRGSASTNADNQPLYVIDGFPVYNTRLEPGSGTRYNSGTRDPLNTINPNDIESIEILKDASATSIYGARAANGVVLITTKRGREGVQVSFNSRYSLQTISEYDQMLNAEEFMDMFDLHRRQFILASKKVTPYGPNPETPTSYTPYFNDERRQQIYNTVGREGTNWFDLVTRRGFINDQNLSVSGGTDKTKFFSSFNMFDQQGVVINSAFNRVSGRLNVDQTINDKLKMGLSFTGSQINNQNAQLGSGKWELVGVLGSAMGFPPVYSVMDTLGNYTDNELYAANPNPVSYNEIDDRTLEKRLLGTVFLDYQIIEGLTFRPSIGFDDASSDRAVYLPNTFKYGASQGGIATRGTNNAFTYLFDMILNYNTSFRNAHFISAMGGYSYQKFTRDGYSTRSSNFFSDAFGPYRLQAGSATPTVGSYRSANVTGSYFSRINYSYRSKYLLTLTGRLDGSDRFGVNNKYGFFPSVAVGWNIANENFMDNYSAINNLKIRASYGQTGNSSIGGNAFAYYGANATYQFGNVINSGMVKIQQENPNLRWETTTEMNFGLDFGILEDRITGGMEYFNKEISDLLYLQRLQAYQQVSYIYLNIGKTQSTGYEFHLNANILSGEFKWAANINLSRYIDRWKERSPDAIATLNDNVAITDYLRPLYYYLPDYILQVGEEAPYDRPYVPGNLVVKDLDGWLLDDDGNYVRDDNGRRIKTGEPDGLINDADMMFLGTFDPKLIMGFGSTFSYKGFDLNLFFNGMYKYWVDNEHYMFNLANTEFIYGGFNKTRDFMNTWTPENPDGTIPAAIQGHRQTGWDAHKFQEISFIRLKDITLGYSFPGTVWGTKVRMYVVGTNLLTFTNLKGMDPETITHKGSSQYDYQGSGLYAYPNQKTVTFGLSVGF